MKLDFEFGKKWIAALRSGEFIQGNLRLRTKNNKFCCLGVAVHIAGLPCKLEELYYTYGETSVSLPGVFRKKIGLSIHDEQILMEMNDNMGNSFEEIADYIEKELMEKL